MGAPNATRRPGGGDAATVISFDETIANEGSPTSVAGQAITLPTLADARTRLIELIQQRPAPQVEVEPTP